MSRAVQVALEDAEEGFNSVFIMKDSGARGSEDQIKQLGGMRGCPACRERTSLRFPARGLKRECGTRGDLQSTAVPATVGGEQGFWVGADVRSTDHWAQAWEGASEATTREPGDLPSGSLMPCVQGMAEARTTVRTAMDCAGARVGFLRVPHRRCVPAPEREDSSETELRLVGAG